MLGELISEGKGKATSTKVIKGQDGKHIRLEMNFQAQAKLFGMDANVMATMTMYERIPGQLYGEITGIMMTADGDSAIWEGFGVGAPTGEGMGIRVRGAVNYQAGSDKLSRLNKVVGVVEMESDGEGNSKTKIWEWK
ncbi:MAG: hypothetical protein FJ317_06740 [SAR202 cluster bacterium]|nr:hypothetical protein [SAR202 cluster bacterium]